MYKSSDLYFQKQGPFNSKCGKCAVNNLLGAKRVTTEMLNGVCEKLEKETKLHYRHALGGDYDVNVLLDVLQTFSKECRWLNGNKMDIYRDCQIMKRERVGFLINRKMKSNLLKAMVGLSDRHWIAVRQHEGQYYLFDSKSEACMPDHIIYIAQFLQAEIEKGSHIIEVLER